MERFHFPFAPYPEQAKLVSDVATSAAACERALFESPTGTGKSLVILTSACDWVKSYPSESSISSGNTPSWHLEALTKQARDEAGRARAARDEWVATHATPPSPRPTVRPGQTRVPVPVLDNNDIAVGLDDLDLLRDESDSSNAQFNHPRAVILSRTHSQLTQLAHELRRTQWSKQMRSAPVASRSVLCGYVYAQGSTVDDRCKALAAGKRVPGCPEGRCPLKVQENIERAAAHVLKTAAPDIEDVIRLAERHAACPFYTAREAALRADVILAPYQMVCSEGGRAALGIEPVNSVAVDESTMVVADDDWSDWGEKAVPSSLPVTPMDTAKFVQSTAPPYAIWIDEVHNFASAASSSYSIDLPITAAKGTELAVKAFIQHLRIPKADTLSNLRTLADVAGHLAQAALPVSSKGPAYGPPMSCTEFLWSCGVNIALQSLADFTARKIGLRGRLVELAGMHAERARNAGDQPSYTSADIRAFFVFLDQIATPRDTTVIGLAPGLIRLRSQPPPGGDAAPALQKARAVIGLGGTLSPPGPLTEALFGPIASPLRTYSHVAKPDNVYAGVYPIGSYTYARRVGGASSPLAVATARAVWAMASGASTVGMAGTRGGSTILFASSWNLAHELHSALKTSAPMAGPRLLLEDRSPDSDTSALAATLAADPYLLVAVLGGRLSEGINFGGAACRLCLIAGIPLPHPADPLAPKPAEAAASAMRQINQAAGRCIRSADDYAAIVFLDERMADEAWSKQLSKWICVQGLHELKSTTASPEIGRFLARTDKK